MPNNITLSISIGFKKKNYQLDNEKIDVKLFYGKNASF